MAGSTFCRSFICFVTVLAKFVTSIFSPCTRKIVGIFMTFVALNTTLLMSCMRE